MPIIEASTTDATTIPAVTSPPNPESGGEEAAAARAASVLTVPGAIFSNVEFRVGSVVLEEGPGLLATLPGAVVLFPFGAGEGPVPNKPPGSDGSEGRMPPELAEDGGAGAEGALLGGEGTDAPVNGLGFVEIKGVPRPAAGGAEKPLSNGSVIAGGRMDPGTSGDEVN